MSRSTKVRELIMPRRKSSFQESWKTNNQWKSWMKAGSDEYHTYCDLCKRDFSVVAHGANATACKHRIKQTGGRSNKSICFCLQR